MNKYENWLNLRKKENGLDIVREALETFNTEIPEMLPKEQLPVSMLFSTLSTHMSLSQDMRSALLDLMLYCEGEETGFGPQTKDARVSAIKDLL